MSEKFKKELIEWIKVIATALVFAFIITQFIRPTLVRGESMYPTLVENDYLIINRMAYKIGEQKERPENIPFLLNCKDRTKIGLTAPACGLCLKNVKYKNIQK